MTADLRRARTAPAARLITEISGPAITVVIAVVIVALHDTRTAGAGAAWGGVAALLCAGVPMAYIVRGARRGRWSDHHVPERHQRAAPLLVGAAAVAVAVVLLVIVDAPRDLVALVIAMLVGLLAVLVITRWWKVSIHTAVAAGVVGILVVLYGIAALLAWLLVLVIAWSRVALGAHTWAQAMVGALVGFVAAVSVFPLCQ